MSAFFFVTIALCLLHLHSDKPWLLLLQSRSSARIPFWVLPRNFSRSRCPKFLGTVPMQRPPQRQPPFAVEALAKTRVEDRLARHSRIRKKALIMGQPCRKMRFSYSKCEWFGQRFGRLNSLRVKSLAEKSSKLKQASCKDYEPADGNLHFDVPDLSFSKLD